MAQPTPPTTGEDPLASLPEYGGAGGGQQAMEYYAAKDFYDLFGRNPTRSELSLLSNYYSGDPNKANLTGGKSAVAQYYQDQLNNPINQKKRDEGNSGQYSGQINDLFQQLLKRGATSAEVQHFGGLLASGQVDPYELQSFIQATPEYQTNQDATFRNSLGDELTDQDTKAFGRQKEDVISRFAGMGRSGSSALDFALTDLMGKIAEKRQGFLANLSASQYGSNKETARADYGKVLGDMSDATNYGRATNDAYRTRGWNVTDYNRQKDDYMSMLNQQKRPWWQYALPAVVEATGQVGAAYVGGKGGGG